MITPPDPPRQPPPGFVRRVCFTGNVPMIVGVLFFIVGVVLTADMATRAEDGMPPIVVPLFLLVFSGTGVVLIIKGVRQGRAAVRAFTHGVATQGEISAVYRNPKVRFNNRSPWVVEYEFSVGNRAFEGTVQSWNESAGKQQPCDPLYVLYVPEDPTQNTIYPQFD